jgi:carotenoid 1,2-hydratase
MIAFIGSVFSPWYRFARRQGGGDPFNHCCMNVALYGRGGKRWAMTERNASALSRDASNLRIGRSGLAWDGTTLSVDLAENTFPVPGQIRGTLKLHPRCLATHEVLLDGAGRHRWGPIAPGARVEVALSDPARTWTGTAYFDTNSGDEPLEEGFVGWDWSRAPLRDGGMAVLYHGVRHSGEAFCTALRYDREGRAADFAPPPVAGLGSGFWGVKRMTLADLGSAPRVVQVLEDAPFYTRNVISSRLLGEDVTAVHESLDLRRFVAPWVQVMLPFKAPRAGVLF